MKQALLRQRLKQATRQRTRHAEIPRRPDPDSAPLSFIQHQMWVIDQMNPGNPAYNLPYGFRLRGRLDLKALEGSFNAVVKRHEALRTTFGDRDGEPRQFIHPELGIRINVTALDHLTGEEQEARLQALASDESVKPFDLARLPLIRVSLFKLGDAEHVLLINLHHIIADGLSIGLLLNEVDLFYRAFTGWVDPHPPELTVQYGDFAHWQREVFADESAHAGQIEFWQKQLGGGLPVLELPGDRPRPALQSFNGSNVFFHVPGGLARDLKSVGEREGCTFFMTVLAAFQVLLQRYSGAEDVVIGTPVASRSPGGADSLIGNFLNMTALRCDLSGDPTFIELLRRSRDTALDAFSHGDLPFEVMMEHLKFERDPSRNPIFQVLLQVLPATASRLGGLELGAFHFDLKFAQFDLSLHLYENADGYQGRFEYCSELFDARTIERLCGHFRNLLEGIVRDPDQGISELPLLTDAERRQVLVEWNQTAVDFPRDACIHQLFETQARRTPDAIAIEHEARRLTYGELNARANQVARCLARQGVGPEVRVGICMERSLEAVVGILGILKAGGAYVPLDPAYPESRLKFMLEDTAAPMLLTQQSLRGNFKSEISNLKSIYLDTDWPLISSEGREDPDAGVNTRNLAYVIYTSGSTGRPKGVALEHRSAVTFVQWARQVFTPEELSSVLFSTSFCFDLSVFEMFVTLSAGGRIIMARDALELPTLPQRNEVTLINTVPSAIAELLRMDAIPASVKTVNLAGEALSDTLVEQLYANTRCDRVYNLYGPTEATTYSTYTPVRRGSPVTIGRPVGGTRCHILDTRRHPVPVGVPGELYLAGDGLARGYHGRPELTEERFVSNPFSQEPGARMYRTGDLCRWLPDGNIQYLGRMDHQVKLRGFRIELGEIEAGIARHPAVRGVVVLAREDTPGNPQLVAYVVAAQPPADLANQLRAMLRASLPDYMVPAAFVWMDALPLTRNGKIDRGRLPAPERSGATGVDHAAPGTPIEEILAGIWEEILGVERVGVEDNFLELGGNSLLAIRVISRVRQALGIELPLRELFAAPTIARMAARLEVSRARFGADLAAPPLEAGTESGPAELSFSQQRLWFLDQIEPGGAAYIISGALELRGTLDAPVLERALGELVRRHESLRTVFVNIDGRPRQVVSEPGSWTLPVTDMSGNPDARGQLMGLMRKEASRGFDLARGPLFRARLYRLESGTHMLLLAMHHIVSDGWSMGILFRELGALYRDFLKGQPPSLPALRIQYRDFALWQRDWLQDGVIEGLLSHWRSSLAGAPQVLELPADRPRPAVESYRGALYSFTLPLELTESLRALARREGATLYMTLLAGFALLLSRYSGQRDFLVGTPVANRNRAEIEDLVGCFVNTLVLRADVSGDPPAGEFLRRIREMCLDTFARQDLPFERLVEEMRPARDLSRNPLFQVMFALENAPQPPLDLQGLTLKPVVLHAGGAQVDLTLIVRETAGGLGAFFEYATDLFEESTIARMAAHWRSLLEAMAASPGSSVWDLPLLNETERRQLLVEWNNTTAELPGKDLCLHQLIEQQARRTPDQPALAFEQRTLTYRELNQRANQLARHLRGMGAKPDARIALCVERSLDMMVGLLAILKAGAAYVPIDTALPRERIAFMLADAGVTLLLTHTSLAAALPADFPMVCIDSFDWTDEEGTTPDDLRLSPDNLAYVVYTSGSTGRPKGVGIEHRSIVNYALGIAERLRLTPGMQHAMVSTIAADLGNTVIFPALITGGCLHLISRERAGNQAELSDYFVRERIDVLKIVPSHLAALQTGRNPERVMPGRRLILGGEASRVEWIERLRGLSPDCEIYNHYGPTETTVGVLTYRVGEQLPLTRTGLLPLGTPLPNSRVLILDSRGQPVPAGVQGELCIGGAGLARGYLNHPDLTAEKFIPDPFSPDGRLYRTGDLARHLPDGNIEFCGRMDHQVKVHGYRIEPGEIEAALREQPAVRDALVLARGDESGNKQLAAYVVPKQPNQPLWANQALHLLPDGSMVAHLNRHETDYIYNEIFVLQAYLRHGITIHDGDIIVDAGANVGLFTVFANRLARNLRIFAFEPNPAAFACLKANADAYGSGVTCLPAGLSRDDKSAELTFFEGFSLLSGFYADAATEREVVKTYALNQASASPDNGQLAGAIDEILDDRFRAKTEATQLRSLSGVIAGEGIERIDLLKINVEKSELDVLLGINPGDWARIRQLVIEVDQREHLDTITSLLSGQGYEVLVEQDPLLRKTELCYVYAIRPSAAGRLVRQQPANAHVRSPRSVEEDIVTPSILRNHLQARLPQYMIPASFTLMAAFPLTANGKLDLNALPDPSHERPHPAHECVEPHTRTEQSLAAIWREVLKVERIGLDDNFFDLGGHSMAAIRTLSRIRDAFEVDLSTRTLFEKPALADLAAAIDALQWVKESKAPVRGTSNREELVL